MRADGKRLYGLLTALSALAVLAAGLLVMLYFGESKQGFHEDEIYTFYSSNRTAGVAWPDGEWLNSSRLTDECVVLSGEGFNYRMVHTVQSWDVHPPFFYDIFHTVCSFFPGVFSKWLGIGVNIAAYIAAFFLLWGICAECGVGRRTTLLFLGIWAVHPVTVSAVMFIRMYMWLTVFVLACLLIHLRIINRGFTKRRMAGVMAVSFLGFLTHYYYLVFFVFTGVTVCFMWFLQRTEDARASAVGERLARIARYAVGCAASLGAAVMIYPASAAHIFRGYRGREAFEAISSPEGWLSRLAFFGGIVNKNVFAGALFIFLFLFVVLAVAGGKGEGGIKAWSVLTAVPSLLYFLVISETALILGDSSIRYLCPVVPLFILLIFTAGEGLIKRLNLYWRPVGRARDSGSMRFWRAAGAAMSVLYMGIFLFMDIRGLFFSDGVLFLYPENGRETEIIREYRDAPAVVLYNEETPENIWRLYDKLVLFDREFYISCGEGSGEREEISDEALGTARRLVVFAADTPDNIDRDARLSELMRRNGRLSERETLSRRDMWTVYVLK